MSLVLLAVATASLPAPVRAFVERADMCRHWSGEEPYDADRGAEIARALRSLRCEKLDRDAAVLQRRYRDAPTIRAAVRRAVAE